MKLTQEQLQALRELIAHLRKENEKCLSKT